MSEKANFRALLPMIVFLVLFIGTGIALTAAGADMPFYQLSATVAIIPAIVLAILQGKDDLNKKIGVFLSGVGEINIITMCMIFLLAGGFASVASAIGGVKATVNFGLSLLPPSMILPGLFLIGAFISTAMGTSMGTVAAIAPIAVGVGEQTDIPLALLLGVVMSGAMFGDNLSMISDTTIAATRTQGCEMKDKFRMNLLIALPAALVTLALLWFAGASGQVVKHEEYQFIRVVPYLAILVMALAGVNVFIVLLAGIVFTGAVGIASVGGYTTNAARDLAQFSARFGTPLTYKLSKLAHCMQKPGDILRAFIFMLRAWDTAAPSTAGVCAMTASKRGCTGTDDTQAESPVLYFRAAHARARLIFDAPS